MTLNVIELAQEYGLDPKKVASTNGGEYSAPCPFPKCSGDDDSFRIWPNEGESGRYWCRKCENSGDAIQFCRDVWSMEFQAACEKVGSDKAKSSSIPPRTAFFRKEERSTSEEAEKEKLDKSKTRSAEIWIKSNPEGSHPYFERKGIKAPADVRYSKDDQGNAAIVVPYRSVEGTIQAIQYVNNNPPPNKFWAFETTPNSAFFEFEGTVSPTVVYLCEGIATAASVWLSESKAATTLSCGASWNIPKVAKVIREKFEDIEIVVCLDDDTAGDKTAKDVADLGLPKISFRRPDFTGMERRKDGKGKFLDKDFNDLQQHKLGGIDKVKEQLQKEWNPQNPLCNLGRVSLAATAEYFRTRPSGVDIGLIIDDEPLELPSAGVTVFAAPTKQGKTHALVNASYLAMTRNPDLDVVFITLEELIHPITVRFLNRHVGMILSKNNTRSLSHHLKYKDNSAKEYNMFSGVSLAEFERKRDEFSVKYVDSCRLRILDFNHMDGTLDTLEAFAKQIQEIKKYLPRVGMVALDYLQLMNLSEAGRMARDEALKEICLGLKNLAATTGLPIVAAAQFNRQVFNEDALHPSAIGEGGAIERQAALVFGMFNRTFPQCESVGKPLKGKQKKEEILLKVMLNRHGPSQQKVVVPYNGNIGRIDFDRVKSDEAEEKVAPANNTGSGCSHVDKEDDWEKP